MYCDSHSESLLQRSLRAGNEIILFYIVISLFIILQILTCTALCTYTFFRAPQLYALGCLNIDIETGRHNPYITIIILDASLMYCDSHSESLLQRSLRAGNEIILFYIVISLFIILQILTCTA